MIEALYLVTLLKLSFSKTTKGVNRLSNQNERSLIEKSKNGDVKAFEDLISGYEKKVFNIVYRIVGDYNDAQDVSQEVFIKAFRAIGNFRGKSSFYTWLYRIAVNECMDAMKARKKTAVLSINAPVGDEDSGIAREIKDDGESLEEKVERNELRSVIEAALNRMPYEHRIMIVLRDVQGFSYEEIAGILKCPSGTVKSRINRARRALKELLLSDKELFLNRKV